MAARAFTVGSAAVEETAAVEALISGLEAQRGGLKVRGALLFASSSHDPVRLQAALAAKLPGVPFLGLTSCLGTAASGLPFGGARSLTALFLTGDGFSVAVASGPRGADARDTGVRLARAAHGSLPTPRFAFFGATPGGEEGLLAGIFSVLDPNLPMCGGTAADDDLRGAWALFTSQGVEREGAALLTCDWPAPFAIHTLGGYAPTEKRGVVTRSQGRTLLEIDGQPAARVYDGWLKHKLAAELTAGGNVLAATTMSPLGVLRSAGGAETFLLAHPERVLPREQALTVFTEIREGETVVLMRSSPTALVQRGALLAERALAWGKLDAAQLDAGLLIYCGGCLLGVRDRAGELLERFGSGLGGKPFVAGFCFGEQGCVVPGRPEHGNLMSSALLLTGTR